MATTSTIPTVKARLVTLLDAELDVPVFYAWPGPNAPSECVYLGRYPENPGDNRIEASSELANIKAGRKHRTETYSLPVTLWSFRPELTSSDAETADVRAFDLKDAIENVLADDPTLSVPVQWARLGGFTSELHPFEKGWVAEIVAFIEVQARLT